MHTTDTAITLTRHELVALLAHAQDDETRPHRTCLRFERTADTAHVVATDGHRQAVLGGRAPGGIPAAWSVPRDVVERLIKSCPAKGCVGFCHAPDRNAAGRDALAVVYLDRAPDGGPFGGGAEVPYTPAPDDFPRWRSVMEHPTQNDVGGATCLNADYLAALALVAKAANVGRGGNTDAGAKRGEPMRLGIEVFPALDPLSPVFFRCGADWTVLICPMRGDAPRDAVKQRIKAFREKYPETRKAA